MQIGFIGLGTMGAPIAMNLVRAGHELAVHDVNRSFADTIIAAGAEWKDTPSDVARASDVIFTSLPGPQETEIVALGPNGLIEGARDGATYFDLSTNSPTTLRKIAAALAVKGLKHWMRRSAAAHTARRHERWPYGLAETGPHSTNAKSFLILSVTRFPISVHWVTPPS